MVFVLQAEAQLIVEVFIVFIHFALEVAVYDLLDGCPESRPCAIVLQPAKRTPPKTARTKSSNTTN